MKHYVYNHIDPRNGQVKYVGKGSGNRAYETKYRRSPVHLAWTKELYDQGLSPIVKIINYFEDENDAYNEEIKLINKLKHEGIQLFNRTPGGRSLSGDNNPMYGRERPDNVVRNKANKGKTFEEIYGEKRTAEIKNKIRRPGIKNGMYGKKRPDLAKRNKENAGKTYEELYGEEKAKEMKAKVSENSSGNNNYWYGKTGELSSCFGRTGEKHPMYGKKQTDEAKNKISNSLKINKGKPIVRSDGKTYICLIDAAKDLGLKDQKEITKVLKGLRDSINGYTFQYVNGPNKNTKQS